MKKLFSLQIDVSNRALKTELEEIGNKSLNSNNDVPTTTDIQNQISILEGRINSTNDEVEIQSDIINEIKVGHLLFSIHSCVSNLISYLHFCRLIFRQYHQTQKWRQ